MGMRCTWTISLPPALSRLAEEASRQEHRTKSELVREALRLYLSRRSQSTPAVSEAGDRLARVGELAEFYQQRHAKLGHNESELRENFRPIRRLHDRLKRYGL